MEIAPTKFLKTHFTHTQNVIVLNPCYNEEEERLKPKHVKQRVIPSPVNLPIGCRFNTRCPEKFYKCLEIEPSMIKIKNNHFARCHLINNY